MGVAAAFATTRWLTTILYGVDPHDAFSFLLIPLGLIVMVAVACVVPARRAARIEPVRVLRET